MEKRRFKEKTHFSLHIPTPSSLQDIQIICDSQGWSTKCHMNIVVAVFQLYLLCFWKWKALFIIKMRQIKSKPTLEVLKTGVMKIKISYYGSEMCHKNVTYYLYGPSRAWCHEIITFLWKFMTLGKDKNFAAQHPYLSPQSVKVQGFSTTG